MTQRTNKLHLPGAMLAAMVLAGCASSSGPAPVVEINTVPRHSASAGKYVAPVTRVAAAHGQDWRPQTYVVQQGDTLYSIAFNFGFDYNDLARLNGIQDPTMIHVGQELRLFPANGAAAARAAPAAAPVAAAIVDQPRVVKLPYSPQAVAQIEQMEKQEAAAETKVAAQQPQPEAAPASSNAAVAGWGLPASGQLIDGFSEKDGRKGVDIAGKLGQPVFASAAGKVVYSGSGLRGYGKLVIVKHNATYLSAYAHNSRIVVKEGQQVVRGQKIAEMGNTDAKRVELHFEIRKLGKPVDPAQYIKFPKS